jgi:hypothetical protein
MQHARMLRLMSRHCNLYAVPTGLVSLEPADEEGWMVATGEGLPQPLQVRFDNRGGRFQLTGLRMESGEPITAAVLRSIPVGELAAAYTPHLRRQFWDAWQEEQRAWQEAGSGEMPPDWMSQRQRVRNLLEQVLPVAASGEAAKLTPRGRGAKPPTDAEYRAFALIYVEERAVGERGALSRTAERWGVHRSTALRWLRNMPKGLLQGETKNDKT